MPSERSELRIARRTLEYIMNGMTIAIAHCETCPPLMEWPTKHLIAGACPRCCRVNPRAWRMAVARRIIATRRLP